MKKTKTVFIVRLGILTALSIVLNIFSIDLPMGNRISFSLLPSFVAGVFLGPLAGGVVGFSGDLLGFFISPPPPPFGFYMWQVGLAKTLFGVIPGLIFKYWKKGNPTLRITVSFILCYIICTAGLNTYALWSTLRSRPQGYPNGFFMYLSIRLPLQTLNTVVNFIAAIALYESGALHKTIGTDNKLLNKKTKST